MNDADGRAKSRAWRRMRGVETYGDAAKASFPDEDAPWRPAIGPSAPIRISGPRSSAPQRGNRHRRLKSQRNDGRRSQRGWSFQGNAALGRALCHNPTALDHAMGPRRSAVAFQATAAYGSVVDNQFLRSSAVLELAAAFGCRPSVLTQSPDARENRAGKSYAAED